MINRIVPAILTLAMIAISLVTAARAEGVAVRRAQAIRAAHTQEMLPR